MSLRDGENGEDKKKKLIYTREGRKNITEVQNEVGLSHWIEERRRACRSVPTK